ncbi:MAG: sulfite exporter TauE/SafE family protein [Treponema sp.]|jgi:sulfite exporter TauE/SafE/copper chaperone CopZ/plastocyanin domain-containing protein|nr:sulfite exporter TauE/SafE family protein [Treponema sp.]
MKTQMIRIHGMTCVQCQNRIEKTLKTTRGIEDAAVDFNTGKARITYTESVIRFNEIAEIIQNLGYSALDAQDQSPGTGPGLTKIAGTLLLMVALYMLVQALGMSRLTAAFPLAEAGMGYGMLFVIGLVTSVHCIAMCGGINLSQCIPAAAPREGKGRTQSGRLTALFPPILYNGGRVISYTAVGVIVGALGQAVSVSGHFQGVVQLAAGVFMVIMGINMLGLFQGSLGTALRRFNLHIPKIFAKKIDEKRVENKNPLIIGLLNGLMPCGPLQAMQLYALSTGSPIAGGVSMFLFSMGTVPLMFGIGALSSFLSNASRGRAFSHQVMRIGAILVTVMGMTMFTYGWGLSGFNFGFADRLAAAVIPSLRFGAAPAVSGNGAFTPVIEGGVQIVNSTLLPGRYPAITVRQGVPVKWTITAPQGSINGCNNRMIIREYGLEYRFKPGENLIEFTPDKTGKFSYSCWMGMIRSSITVVAEGEPAAAEIAPDIAPSPAGVGIPTEQAVLAEMQEGYQQVGIQLKDDGIEPALIVMQRGIPALWTITKDSLDPGNDRLIFPGYYTQVAMEMGDNVIQLLPTEDFDFSTGDHVFYGYVKVVDDLHEADMEAIKAEVAEFETLIYPEAYFEAAGQGTSCCVR